jgi:RNA polymerase sigma-54 factor
MSLSASLQFRQSQSLTMTPQLMQSIRLLQFTSFELSKFIEDQVESNPLLELKSPSDGGAPTEEEFSAGNLSDDKSASADESSSSEGDLNEFGQMETSLDVNMDNVYPDDERQKSDPVNLNHDLQVGASGEISASGTDIDLDSFAARAPGLREMMNEQIAMTFKSVTDRAIAASLVDHLDDAGYLRVDLEDISLRLGSSAEQVNSVLSKAQTFDPPGIFARGLGECLKLQLVRKNRLDPAMDALLDNLELLAKRDFKSLKKICLVDEADLLDMMSEIQSLDPKPGACFETQGVQTIIPDVLVKNTDMGEWLIEMNPQTLPRVLVDQTYHSKVTRGLEKSNADYEFMTECLQSANWLVRSLDQRAKTIVKVASEIVKQQTEFFAEGVSHLKPLNLKAVAEAIEMHESTVSRVTSNKYMMTPRGLFELKYFFTVSIGGSEAGSDAHSAESVRFKIKLMIDSELAERVLSDDEIVKALKKDGVDIARRTVAKYREALNIPSSVQRRREKKMRAQGLKTKLSA